jgi:NAD(P)-dependent dehydrogenase (short-subunit alcohol dehydrogenase family)
MNRKLQDRTAVITGASKGLGKAMALALAAEGARIALVSRDAEKLTAVAAEIAAAGGQAGVFPADVTSEEDVRRVERVILALYPKVNILINNAGVNVRKPVVDFALEEWRRVMDTNVTAAFLMCRSFVPAMVGQGYGRILNMTSIMSHISLPGRIAYSTSKTALLGMTRTLALELAPKPSPPTASAPVLSPRR